MMSSDDDLDNEDVEEIGEEYERPDINYIDSRDGKYELLSKLMDYRINKENMLSYIGRSLGDRSEADILEMITDLTDDEVSNLYNEFAHTKGPGRLIILERPLKDYDSYIEIVDGIVNLATKLPRIHFITKIEDKIQIKFVFLKINKSRQFYLKAGRPTYITPSQY
ncbi:hypothetical protein LCGC14_2621570, partial [marine sediment metagenome]